MGWVSKVPGSPCSQKVGLGPLLAGYFSLCHLPCAHSLSPHGTCSYQAGPRLWGQMSVTHWDVSKYRGLESCYLRACLGASRNMFPQCVDSSSPCSRNPGWEPSRCCLDSVSTFAAETAWIRGVTGCIQVLQGILTLIIQFSPQPGFPLQDEEGMLSL